MVITRLSEVDFSRSDLPVMPPADRMVMTTPDHFDIEYVINPHMAGNIGSVDKENARAQWLALKEAFESCGTPVDVVEGMPGQPDMVFCANQTLPYLLLDGTKGVVLSRMHAPQRAGEVQYFREYFEAKWWAVKESVWNGETDFEGMGDALWHVGRRLLWGGYGFRTDKSVYDRISEGLDTPVLALQLDDPEFYHLDTCLCILNEETALIFAPAFQPEGLELIRHFFPTVIEAPEDEARELFACNAHSPDGRHAVIQRGCVQTNRALRDLGFTVIEVDTDEYLKSGGSVFCMKLMTW
ncbi:MAG: arginine deiminase-related protein [Bacteroidota bacterium]|nr:arginine deiminase-related protein [Bacteroidota bacterium]